MDRETEKSKVCTVADDCSLLEAEMELSIESLRSHLSEQRHDFFNLLQILYGYTQLKKSDKVLSHITDYCRKMENIGRLYNARCIKLADLLYTKGKEADNIDLNLEVNADISYEQAAKALDDQRILHVVDHALSGLYYMLDAGGYKETHVVFFLKEEADSFRVEVFCMEIREGRLAGFVPVLPEKEMFWEKIERTVTGFAEIKKYCSDNGFKAEAFEAEAEFLLVVSKDMLLS
ncbi:MAG TPA: Spo0B domain-containing protein, partial [Negativicutes bacterium]|nr:Spo0B domain-containing protein [Negativicutes bacterium]